MEKILDVEITLFLAVDRFISEVRSVTNLIGDGMATVVAAKRENKFDTERARRILNREFDVEIGEPLLSETKIAGAKFDGVS